MAFERTKMRLYRAKRRLRDEFAYRGNGVTCPCCGGSFRAFMPYGNKVVRPNERCPRCFSAERTRLLICYLRERTGIFTEQMKLLHFAPEAGVEPRLRARPKLDYTTADLEAWRADEAMDITDIPRPDNTFDAILCSHVLEHVPDDRAAMRELYRVLKPGGFAIVPVPLYPELDETYENPAITTPEARLEHFDQRDHVRKYAMDYFDRLREAGFVVNRIDYAREVDPDKAERFGFGDFEQIERVDKPV